ncbi:MAG TPA: ABC transporter permease [candidate division Zixibacteria bacterium]|nr:ABC transporter permease [candidate division Zixibacteria bacterium]
MGLVTAIAAAPRSLTLAERRARTRQRVLGIIYLVTAAVMVVGFALPVGDVTSTFTLNLGGTAITVPDLVLPSAATGYLLAGAVAFAGAIQLTRGFGARWALVLGGVAAAFVFGFLVWVAAGQSMNLTGVLQSTLQRSVPIVFGALAGVLCERSGVVNIAIEGMLLTGAFVAAVVGSVTDNSWIGMIAAVLAGGLMAGILAVLAIRYRVDQIIAGFFINIFATGLTSFLAVRWLAPYQQELNRPEVLGAIPIPLLSEIPILGPILFRHNIFVYFLFVLIIVIHLGLFYTRWGLRVRAVGEHPKAADTVGIDVYFVRYRNVILGGMVAGLGGAFFTIGSTGGFEREMTAGRGFIGLAAMIFGGWNPIGSFLAGLVFGFADAVQSRLSILNIAIPSEFLLMVPYVVTIVVVAGLVGRTRAPAADGKPYVKE